MSFIDRYFTTKTVTRRGYPDETVRELNVAKAGFHAGAAVFALIMVLAYWPLRSVPVGSRGVVQFMGHIERVVPDGAVWVMPWQRLDKFSVRVETAQVDKAPGATKDLQQVDTSLTIRYRINPNKVADVFENYSHDGDLSSYVQTAIQEAFKAVTAKYEATDLIAQRAVVSQEIQTQLQAKLDKYSAVVVNIDMRNFEFNPQYMAAVNEKVTQEQKRLAAENQVKTINAEQQAKVAVAEAEANARKAKADGEKYATIANAQAQAESTRAIADANAHATEVQGKAVALNPQILELKRIEVQLELAKNYKGDVPQFVLGGTNGGGASNFIPFMDVNKALENSRH